MRHSGRRVTPYLYQASQEILKSRKNEAVILCLSDLDPSGKLSMQTIEPGLRRHLGKRFPITVEDLAVTMSQVEQYALPSRPTKIGGNAHWRRFAEQYGPDATESVELDAFEPTVLRQLVSDAIAEHWTHDRTLEQMKATESEHQEEIRKLYSARLGLAQIGGN